MPFWLQLAAAGIAALAGGVMGIALIPFLAKQRFCEPVEEKTSANGESVGTKLLPTMCGLLPIFGSLTGLAAGYPLYRQFCVLDTTSSAVQAETSMLVCCLCIALLAAGIGSWADVRRIRHMPLKKTPLILQGTAVFLLLLAFLYIWEQLAADIPSTMMDLGFCRVDLGAWYYPIMAAMSTCCLLCGMHQEEHVDGCTLTSGGLLCLAAAVLMLLQEAYLLGLLMLTVAGGCMGGLCWNLHPAKCRLGLGGRFWLSAVLMSIAMMYRMPLLLLLFIAFHAVQLLPTIKKENNVPSSGNTLQARLLQQGLSQYQVIAVIAGFSAFCGVMAVLLYQ